MNLNELKINNLRLTELMSEYDITEQELEYVGREVVAELLGWQINFFRKKDDLLNTFYIWFFDIVDNEIKGIANILLNRIGLELQFGKEIDVIEELGEADFVDEIIENTIRYGYVLSADKFVSIGLTKGKLSYLEVLNDENIIKEIVSARNKKY